MTRRGPVLDLWKKQLGAIRESVREAVDVETLILADNGLETVSADIARLKRLRTLDLGHNRITSIPDAIGQLGDLSVNDLRGNPLADLPASLARLRSNARRAARGSTASPPARPTRRCSPASRTR